MRKRARRSPSRKSKPRPPAPARYSLGRLARKLGVSGTAVQKAVRSGRLCESVGRDKLGPYVLDEALALREWASGAARPAAASSPAPAPAQPVGPAIPAEGTLAAAALRLADERRAALELANRRKRGELLDAAKVEREHFEVARITRERILNVPERMADLGPAVVKRLREELRQALASIADEVLRGGDA